MYTDRRKLDLKDKKIPIKLPISKIESLWDPPFPIHQYHSHRIDVANVCGSCVVYDMLELPTVHLIVFWFSDGDDKVHPAVPVFCHQPRLLLGGAADPRGQHSTGGVR